jgi:hypothetical protein
MKAKNLVIWGWLLAAAFGAAGLARADAIDLTLLDPNQTVAQGTASVLFDATLFNPSATDTIFLNSARDECDCSSYFAVDDSPFYNNAPLSLAPGQSSGTFELFAVDLSSTIPPGTYQDTFSILGGPDGGTSTDFNVIGSAPFSVTVNSSSPSVPEPGTLSMLLAGILALLWVHVRRRAYRRLPRS